MYRDRFVATRCVNHEEDNYSKFEGRIHVVNLADINGKSEEFDGKDWLEEKVRQKQPVGWDLEWQPDRSKDSDNPIALMQFADDKTALLLRTHKTRQWLPSIVIRALLSDTCTKISVGWDGPDKQKMNSTFDFEPQGILDLAHLSPQKGLQERGLKGLAQHFGWKMRKDSRCARSNWAAHSLTEEQIAYAAEDAYFTYLVHEKLNELPDQDVETPEVSNMGQLALQPGWKEQGIERKHDGLYCKVCTKGPMNTPSVVAKHLDSGIHKKKYNSKQGLDESGNAPALTEEQEQNGIIAGDNMNGVKAGEFKCTTCDVTLGCLANVDSHIRSKKHQKLFAPVPEPPKEAKGPAKEPFEDDLWNLPDYVSVIGDKLRCTLCESLAPAVKSMYNHLGGNNHAKRSRANNKDEIIFVITKEVCQLQYLATGRPVVRTGFKQPSAKDIEAKQAAEAAAAAAAEAEAPLPEGWQMHKDPKTGELFYWHQATRSSQWDRPGAAPVPEKQHAADAESKVQREELAKSSVETGAPVNGILAESGYGGACSSTAEPQGASKAEFLPAGWSEHVTNDGMKFYYNSFTQESQWKRPKPEDLQDASDDWEEHYTEDGKKNFYYNIRTKESSWTLPQRDGNWSSADNTCHARVSGSSAETKQQDDQHPAAQTQASSCTTEQQQHQQQQHRQLQQQLQLQHQQLQQRHGQQQGQGCSTLPPGWREVVDTASGKTYYFDNETQVASWKPPKPYVHEPWIRQVNGRGAYWELPSTAEKAGVSFFEDDTGWQRIEDRHGRIYWSSRIYKLRFFEVDPAEDAKKDK